MSAIIKNLATKVPVVSSVIQDGPSAWKELNGIFCIYKPLGFYKEIHESIRSKLAKDLNAFEPREPEELVEIRLVEKPESSVPRDKTLITSFPDQDSHTIQILKSPNYADHPLVQGPRYQPEDIKLFDVSKLGAKTTGLSVYGIGRGTGAAFRIEQLKWLRGYRISGQFGLATENNWYTGNILEKSTYHKVKTSMFEHVLSNLQASHQRMTFEATNLKLNTEQAYQIASQGLIRPMEDKTPPLIYSMKLIDFNLPNFTIEVHCINEKEAYLMELIARIGRKLASTATTTKCRCIKYGPFDVDLALLQKHWTVEHVGNNIRKTREVLKDHNLKMRKPLLDKEDLSKSS